MYKCSYVVCACTLNAIWISNSVEKTVKAYRDVGLSGAKTIRTSSCTMLFSGHSQQCDRCTKFRVTLNAILRRHDEEQKRSAIIGYSSHTNFRYLNTPEKNARLHGMQDSLKEARGKYSG